MKQKLFGRLAAAAVLLLGAASASAHDFGVNGIYYNINSNGTSVSVTYPSYYYDDYSGAVTIPASVTYSGKTYSVTSIGYKAFYCCSGLTSVSIGNSVTSIGEYAFRGCSGLKSVKIGNSVTEIGKDAFYDCSGLKKVEIIDLEAWCKISFYDVDANPIYYSHNLFLYGQEIKNLIIPETVQELKSRAFYGCSGLTSVVIPNSVTSIGSSAFSNCRGLKSVSIGNSVKSIGEYAFSNCGGLTWVSIGNSVTEIGKDAFYNCSGLQKVEISDLEAWCKISFYNGYANPTYYSHHLFLNGQEIKNLIIPESIQELKFAAFLGCSGLTSLELPNSVTSIGEYAFRGCSGLESVSIGNSVTSIGEEAFSGCSGWKLVLFNAKNCSINNSVFSSSGLTLVIGEDVEKIGVQLLSSNATKIVTQASTPPVITAQTFYDKSCPLYVTQGAYAKYWTADIWEDFSDMKPIDNPITKIELNKSSLNIVANNSAQLSATITPGNATLSDIYWVSDNPAIASVDQNGKVTGLKTGTTTITAMAIDGSGVKATCLILVDVDWITAENLTLNPSELTLAINQSANITPVITPDNATSTSLEWSTSNAGVASFKANSDGSITVLGAADGVATITCRTTDGSDLTATCTVTVGTGAVDGIEADAVTVRGANGVIRVEGVDGARVEVFNTAGVCIYSGTDTEIYVPQRGLYVVKVAGRATKLAM